MKMISIVVPVHNEADNILPLHAALTRTWTGLAARYDYELLFVNDGSSDTTGAVLQSLADTDGRVRYVEFSRNFGKELATTAGLHHARGEATLIMDGDLQHPPELIPTFIDHWERGADIVVGVRDRSHHAGWAKTVGSRLFYRIMGMIGDKSMIPHATDFRLLDRAVVDVFNRFTERNRITRGLLDWMGFERVLVPFTADPRRNGTPSYNVFRLTRLAFHSFVSLSLFPLKLAGYLGLLITFCSGGLGLFILFNQYVFDRPVNFVFSGAGSLAVFNSFLIGIVLICLGFIALYIANIHQEVINRPMYVVRREGGAAPRAEKRRA
jgi:dolichol-phosphate mannosyltransferase